MTITQRKIKDLIKDSYFLYKILLFVSGLALGILTWNAVSYVRSFILLDNNLKTYS
jgi:hypothetical protein